MSDDSIDLTGLGPGLGPSPLADIPTGELLAHVGRPPGPLKIGDRRSDHHLAIAMAVLILLTFALIVFTAVVQVLVLRSLHAC